MAETHKKPVKGWLWPVLFIAGFAAAMVISGIHKDTAPNGQHVIADIDEYLDVMKEAASLSVAPMASAETNNQISPDQTQQLRKAAILYEELERFKPKDVGPFFLGGRINLILGELPTAELDFKQVIDNAPLQGNGTTQAAVQTLTADAHDYLSQCYEADNQWKEAYFEASQAIQMNAAKSTYYYDRARAEVQMKQYAGAKADLLHVMTIEPTNSHAIFLLRALPKQ